MFGHRYFASRYFAPRYFGTSGEAGTGGGYFGHRYFAAGYYSPRYYSPQGTGPTTPEGTGAAAGWPWAGTPTRVRAKRPTRRELNEELLKELFAEAAAKTANAVNRKALKPTVSAVKAAAKAASVEQVERVEDIWWSAADLMETMGAIDERYYEQARSLARHFAKVAEEIEEDSVETLLLLG